MKKITTGLGTLKGNLQSKERRGRILKRVLNKKVTGTVNRQIEKIQLR